MQESNRERSCLGGYGAVVSGGNGPVLRHTVFEKRTVDPLHQ